MVVEPAELCAVSPPLVLALSLTAWSAWPSAPVFEVSFLLDASSSSPLSPEDDAVAVVETVKPDVAATAIAPSAPVAVPSLESPRATLTVVVSNCIATETDAPTAALDPAASALVWVTNAPAAVAVTETSPVAVISPPVPR